ncbi:hypothetical protein OIU76_018132 [Salix suchowensis]|nr:hypothetical protein OIU76_018132 [Salix suchowensis]
MLFGWLIRYKYSRKRTRNHAHACKVFSVCCMFCVFFSYSLTFNNLLRDWHYFIYMFLTNLRRSHSWI